MKRELPHEIETLDLVNERIRQSIRDSAISHCLDPIRREVLQNGEALTKYETSELRVKDQEDLMFAY